MSWRYGPSPRAMNGGCPPTAPKARAGLLTPPGRTRQARPKASRLRTRSVVMEGSSGLTAGQVFFSPRPRFGGEGLGVRGRGGQFLSLAQLWGAAAHLGQ